MRILLVTEFFPATQEGDFTGGVEARTFFMARELARSHQVTVLCAQTEGTPRSDTLNGFSVVRVGPLRQYTQQLNFSRIFNILATIWQGSKLPADIVEGTNFANQVAAYLIGKIKKIPIVLWTPDVWIGSWMANMRSRVSTIIGEVVERYNLSHRNVQFIAISRTVAGKMECRGVPRDLITVVPCGLDHRFINKIKATKASQPTLCVISRLVHYKSLDVVICALPTILKYFPDTQLKIVGQGPKETDLRLLVEKLDLQRCVSFLGFVPRYADVMKILKSSHLFVSPSTTEGFGMATIEAMAAGTPFVAADIEVNREISQMEGGLLFKPGNHLDLAKKVVFVLSDKRKYSRFQKEGQELAKRYDWKDIAWQTENVYRLALRTFKR